MSITLRPYQHEAVCSAITELMVQQSTLLVLATGLGKTTIVIEIAKNFERTLIIAHRKELIDQAAKRVFQQLGIKPGIEMGSKKSKGETIIVGSIQTLISRAVLLQPPDLVIIDEAHHAVSETYRMVLSMWPLAKILGVTATPDRQDQLALGNVFETVAYRYETPDAINDGWLAPITWDKANGILDLQLACASRRTIIFTPNVAQAIDVADELGPDAGVVYGSLPKKERTAVLDRFKAGELQYMVNCNILTEGFDCLDSETEVLTNEGWKGLSQIDSIKEVYSLNRDTYKIELTPASRVVQRGLNPDEKMVEIVSQHVNIRVTEGHQFHIKYRDKGGLSDKWLTKSALEISQRKSAYVLPLSGFTEIPFEGVPLSDDEIKFVAWFMTDGGYSGYSDVTISQSKDYHHEIRNLLTRLGMDFKERLRQPTGYANGKPCYEFRIPKGTHKGSMKRNGWAHLETYLDKNVSALLHQMNVNQFEIFWIECLKGDGSVSEGKSGWLWCDRIEQANAYTQMAVLRGYSASYAPEITKAGKTVYRVSVRDAQWITSAPGDKRSARANVYVPETKELVWCVTNKNSTLITRRKGKIVILGNCPEIEAVAMMRSTDSRAMFVQCLGRGLRLAPGKEDCLYVDLTLDMPDHSLECPYGPLDGIQLSEGWGYAF